MVNYIENPSSGTYGNWIENLGNFASGTYGNYVENNNLASGFNGNFASLFSGAYQVIQSDLGITYGGTLSANGTTPPVITFTGSLLTTPVPITITCTLLGARGTWTGSVSYDGGSTQAQTFTSAATVALTGAGSGLTLNIAVGNAATNNTWKATCSGFADQSGNNKNYSQAAAGSQPILVVGLNGRVSLSFDGVDDGMQSSLAIPAPTGATPTTLYAVVSVQTNGGQSQFFSDGSGVGHSVLDILGDLTHIEQYSANGANLVSVGANTWYRVLVTWTGSTADKNRWGSISTTGTSAGSSPSVAKWIGRAAGFGLAAKMNLLMATWLPFIPTASQLGTYDAATASFYGAGNVAL